MPHHFHLIFRCSCQGVTLGIHLTCCWQELGPVCKGTHLVFHVGGNRARRWTPTQQPLIVTLPPLLSRSYFHYSRQGKEMRKYLTEQKMQQGNTWQTEDRKTSSSLRYYLLITVCPFHFKGFTIYRSPLGMVICLNYTFSVPDKRLLTLYKGITVTPGVVHASSVSSYDRNTFTRGAPCLCLVRRLLYTFAVATCRSTPHLRRRDSRRFRPGRVVPLGTSRPGRLEPRAEVFSMRSASGSSRPSVSKHNRSCLRRRRPAPLR
jgi:hypothetical protein